MIFINAVVLAVVLIKKSLPHENNEKKIFKRLKFVKSLIFTKIFLVN